MDSCERIASVAAFPRGAWRAAASCGPNGGNCVEVNLGVPGLAGVRDGKSTGPALVFDSVGWEAFMDAARSARFDRA
ncbi:MAG TPA: DUF397 domain-containing protein [Actinophytocola sp.]|uniref:DUF397 domain-containing protein n=1 Tax=Actinophytocola sp. TaxID=1872138 RepID=UPI002DDD29BA|nr:DUF397 domain-containing protein [Actinophytocola sp.]HEV2777912.1 DUF397 domain-containing protein [Actinophytocola sp.]